MPGLTRSFASETHLPVAELTREIEAQGTAPASRADIPSTTSSPNTPKLSLSAFESPVLATLYTFPKLEPSRYALYHPKFLNVPLRRDILHRAVVYEGDSTRQGTASTKWRRDVHGSNRKIVPQKGTGRARAGDKKSPTRKGGGVAFGPHPRDFSTELPQKIYARAVRTALSYRYKKGELIILDNEIRLPDGIAGVADGWFKAVMTDNRIGSANGRSLLVTSTTEEASPELFESMAAIGRHGMLRSLESVDVKNLLETNRIVIERQALQSLLWMHCSDLGPEYDTEFEVDSPFVQYFDQTL